MVLLVANRETTVLLEEVMEKEDLQRWNLVVLVVPVAKRFTMDQRSNRDTLPLRLLRRRLPVEDTSIRPTAAAAA